MKIWTDDERDPAVWRPGEEWIWIKTAQEAIDLITDGKVFEISLDHDLGETEEFDADHNTGYVVAEYIEECAYFGSIGPIKWSVHSANPVGYEKIKVCMEQADRYWAENLTKIETLKKKLKEDI